MRVASSSSRAGRSKSGGAGAFLTDGGGSPVCVARSRLVAVTATSSSLVSPTGSLEYERMRMATAATNTTPSAMKNIVRKSGRFIEFFNYRCPACNYVSCEENLRDEGSSSIGASLLTKAADQLESIGSSLNGKDLDDESAQRAQA